MFQSIHACFVVKAFILKLVMRCIFMIVLSRFVKFYGILVALGGRNTQRLSCQFGKRAHNEGLHKGLQVVGGKGRTSASNYLFTISWHLFALLEDEKGWHRKAQYFLTIFVF